jgi:hypothetical protein
MSLSPYTVFPSWMKSDPWELMCLLNGNLNYLGPFCLHYRYTDLVFFLPVTVLFSICGLSLLVVFLKKQME